MSPISTSTLVVAPRYCAANKRYGMPNQMNELTLTKDLMQVRSEESNLAIGFGINTTRNDTFFD